MTARRHVVSMLAIFTAAAIGAVPLRAQGTPPMVRPSLLNVSEVQQSLAQEYPAELRDAGIGGAPLIWVHINASGLVDSAQVAESSGFEGLDAAAVRVARVMRWSPARTGTAPTATSIQIPIRFQVVRR